MVADEHGNELPIGEAGEMLVHGKHIMREYWNHPMPLPDVVNGWLRTIDVGVWTMRVSSPSRTASKTLIVRVARTCIQRRSRVCFKPSGDQRSRRYWSEQRKVGESPLAVVVSDDALTGDEILEFCQGKLAKFKQPKAVEFIDVIPRNPSGKILKRVLKSSSQPTLLNNALPPYSVTIVLCPLVREALPIMDSTQAQASDARQQPS